MRQEGNRQFSTVAGNAMTHTHFFVNSILQYDLRVTLSVRQIRQSSDAKELKLVSDEVCLRTV